MSTGRLIRKWTKNCKDSKETQWKVLPPPHFAFLITHFLSNAKHGFRENHRSQGPKRHVQIHENHDKSKKRGNILTQTKEHEDEG